MHAIGSFIGSFFAFVFGTIMVLAVMALVAWVTSLLEAMDAGRTVSQAPAPAPAGAPSASILEPAPGATTASATTVSAPNTWGANIDPTIVAVITAAVTTALAGRPFRIQRIQMAANPETVTISTTSWAQAGRQTIHASHAFERKFR